MPKQKAICTDILKAAPHLVGAAIDATGLGMNLAEDLGREFGLRESDDGAGLVWMINFSQGWYNENMPPLKVAFEDGTLALAKDPEHVSDLRLVKVIRGIPSIPPEREGEKGKKRHGDFAVALALAHFASRMQWREYAYEPVPTGMEQSGDAGRDFWTADDRDEFNPRDLYRQPLGARIRGGF